MRRRLIALVLLTLAAPALSAEPADIPRVKTLADLRAVGAVDAGDGWSVRLGYGEPGDDVGASWLVLYCLAERADDHPAKGGPDGPVVGDPIGPVSSVWERNPRGNEVKQLRPERARLEQEPGLFCVTLPAARTVEMRLTVQAAGERVLARRSFPAPDEPRPAYWHSFTAVSQPAGGGNPVDFVADEADPAYPLFWEAPVALPKDEPAAGERTPIDLPGLGGAGEVDALRLSLTEGSFVIRADHDLPGGPPEKLLARWWVNGEAVVAPTLSPSKAMQQQRARKPAKEFRIAFGLPDHLPPPKAGDRIGLQVLYAPRGKEFLPRNGQALVQRAQQMLEQQAVDRPLLSNRLEFELTDDLLRQADHAPREK